MQAKASFPQNRWWVAGLASELTDQPLAKTLLNHRVVLFRTADGQASALEDRCCHKALPLSCGTVEARGLRCGYHGLLFNAGGQCIEIPGQARIPEQACVRSYPLLEQDDLLWIWIGEADRQPLDAPPAYRFHQDPAYRYGGGHFRYEAPYQLIHDNLLDLSHLGYVHTKTIGGNPNLHMNAQILTSGDGEVVRVVRHMPDCEPPPTYTAAWPFTGRIDRWQEVEFQVSHLLIWTGGMDVGQGSLDDPDRDGFHMRGFHAITPETETTSHYFWTLATNPHPSRPGIEDEVVRQTAFTFAEDQVIIEKQWQNQQAFPDSRQIDIHVDAGPNRARRVIKRLIDEHAAVAV